MTHICDACDQPATQRCSRCRTPSAWYCSRKCQQELWTQHIFECNPRKPISTAYYLARACLRDVFPDDPQTCEDYGFNRAFTPENRSKLLGLYIGLISYERVSPGLRGNWWKG